MLVNRRLQEGCGEARHEQGHSGVWARCKDRSHSVPAGGEDVCQARAAQTAQVLKSPWTSRLFLQPSSSVVSKRALESENTTSGDIGVWACHPFNCTSYPRLQTGCRRGLQTRGSTVWRGTSEEGAIHERGWRRAGLDHTTVENEVCKQLARQAAAHRHQPCYCHQPCHGSHRYA